MVVLLTGSQCGSDMTAGSSALKHMRDIYRDVPGGLTIPHPPDTQSILIPREGGLQHSTTAPKCNERSDLLLLIVGPEVLNVPRVQAAVTSTC